MSKQLAVISEPKAVSFWNISRQIVKVLKANGVDAKLYPWDKRQVEEKNVLMMGNVFGLTINHMLRFIPDKNIIFYGVTEGIPILNENNRKIAKNFTLITPSEHSSKCLQTAGLDVDAVIPHGVDFSVDPDMKFYESIKTLIPRQTSLNPTNIMLCIAGNVQRKAIDKLLVAYKIIQTMSKDSFLILHTGIGDVNISAMEKALDLKRLLFTNSWGMLDPAKIAALYKLCDYYVQPSMVEGFGLTYLEAFRWQKPIIGVDCPSVNEIVKNGHTGILIPVTRIEDTIWQQHHAIRLHHFDIDNLVQAMLIMSDEKARQQMASNAKCESMKWDMNGIYSKFTKYLN